MALFGETPLGQNQFLSNVCGFLRNLEFFFLIGDVTWHKEDLSVLDISAKQNLAEVAGLLSKPLFQIPEPREFHFVFESTRNLDKFVVSRARLGQRAGVIRY